MSALTVLQANLNHCRAAQDILWQAVHDYHADIVIISEPHRPRPEWYTDPSGTLSIWCVQRPPPAAELGAIRKVHSSDGCVGLETRDFIIFGCYFSPSVSMATYEGQLSNLSAGITSSKPTLIAGDFNARSIQWGSDKTDARGYRLLRVCEQAGLIPVNSKGGPTFIRNRQQSRIDLMACTRELRTRLINSLVSTKYTGSDHNYLVHHFAATPTFTNSSMNSELTIQYRPPSMEEWASIISTNLALPPDTPDWIRERTIFNFESRADVDNAISELESWYSAAQVPRTLKKRKSVSWWNRELTKLRLSAARSRAKWHRLASRTTNVLENDHPLRLRMISDRRALIKAVRKSKDTSWSEMINEVARYPWSKPYKSVMKRLKGNSQVIRLNENEFRTAVSQLFVTDPPLTIRDETTPPNTHMNDPSSTVAAIPVPDRPPSPQPGPSNARPRRQAPIGLDAPPTINATAANSIDPPSLNHASNRQGVLEGPQDPQDPRIPHPFSARDVVTALGKVSKGKAPGRDGITGEALRPIYKLAPEWVRDLFNACYRLSYFPASWKVGRLVLIPKPGKPFHTFSDLRPLCMLSNFGKGFEYALREHLEEALQNSGDLSPRQFGFRRKRSTLQAMKVVMSEWNRARSSAMHCLLIGLDVKNAFNTVRWENIISAARRRNFPPLLILMLENYLNSRFIGTTMPDGTWIEQEVFAGVPQGSVLGPFLWNLAYDSILEVVLPRNVTTIAFADDLAVIIVGLLSGLREIAEISLQLLSIWYRQNSLTLATQKTEAVLLTGRRVRAGLSLQHETSVIQTISSMRYLGTLFSNNRTFRSHIVNVTNKASKVAQHLAWLLPNLRGGGYKPRMLYYRVTESIVLYAAPVWHEAVQYQNMVRLLLSTQKLGLIRVARSYYTVSHDALTVLTGCMPWNLTIQITGHGCFASFLYRIKHSSIPNCTPNCWFCDPPVIDDVEHTVFHCTRWAAERTRVILEVGVLYPETLVDCILDENRRTPLLAYISEIMSKKESIERARKRGGLVPIPARRRVRRRLA
ncbi:uncharacterized protein LOC123989006 [Osmia bicornis bicornis]|uniref:uncharacterized protein LOC123989006 n=1 Tax=Osmia bicornis bicornis TaxID=1437191 RepID=UPI001EAEC563|nr:uncharacterized protein LOC123989006 [Osmia bicornis bicornis]